jgi:hypothetical protein
MLEAEVSGMLTVPAFEVTLFTLAQALRADYEDAVHLMAAERSPAMVKSSTYLALQIRVFNSLSY